MRAQMWRFTCNATKDNGEVCRLTEHVHSLENQPVIVLEHQKIVICEKSAVQLVVIPVSGLAILV